MNEEKYAYRVSIIEEPELQNLIVLCGFNRIQDRLIIIEIIVA